MNEAGVRQYASLPPTPQISGGFGNGVTAWAPDGRRTAVVSQNTNLPASIWLVDLEASAPFRQPVELPTGPRIRGIAWTREGAAILIGYHDSISDIVMLDSPK